MLESSINYLTNLEREISDLKEELESLNKEIEILKYKNFKKEQIIENIQKESD